LYFNEGDLSTTLSMKISFSLLEFSLSFERKAAFLTSIHDNLVRLVADNLVVMVNFGLQSQIDHGLLPMPSMPRAFSSMSIEGK